MKFSKIKKYLSPELLKWIEDASIEDVAQTLRLGYYASKNISYKNQEDQLAVRKGQQGEKYVYKMLKPIYKVKDMSKYNKSCLLYTSPSPRDRG